MNFYKYPECEPTKEGWYLCVTSDEFGSKLFTTVLYYSGQWQIERKVLAFTNLTPEEAAKNAQI